MSLPRSWLFEPRLDHDGVNHGDRGRAQGNTADLRAMKRPVEDELAERESAEEGQQEGHGTDRQARLPMFSQGDRIDLGACEKRQHEGSCARQEGGDIGLLDMFLETRDVAENGSDENLDEGNRDPEPDADDRCQQRHADPDGEDVIRAHPYSLLG